MSYLHVEILECYGVLLQQIIGVLGNIRHTEHATEMSCSGPTRNLQETHIFMYGNQAISILHRIYGGVGLTLSTLKLTLVGI